MHQREHLEGRHFEVSRYSGVMCFEDVVILPLWNLSGQYVGYQQYRPGAPKEYKNDPREGRYYTSLHGEKHHKPLGVWGVESLEYDPRYVVIVEGVFDACRLHNLNVPCVALLNSSYKPFRNWLTALGRKVFKIEDDHGSQLGPYQNLCLPEGRGDLGECSESEVESVVQQIYKGAML